MRPVLMPLVRTSTRDERLKRDNIFKPGDYARFVDNTANEWGTIPFTALRLPLNTIVIIKEAHGMRNGLVRFYYNRASCSLGHWRFDKV